MCEQSSVIYAHGDIVWCKLGSCWWPGEIYDLNRLPPEVTAGFKKPPIAAVRFFQEDKYEYVRNLDHIYHYNCRRKNEFIKKGLDMHRASIKHMDKFPIDVCTAEKLTNGDPDIITSEEFGPNKRVSYSNLFGTPTNKKSGNKSSLSGNRTPRRNKNSITPRMTPKSVPLKSIPRSYSSGDACSPTSNPFNCQFCNFVTGRLNVIVIHNKSHFSGELPIIKNKKTKASMKASTSGKKRVCKMTPSITSSIDEDLLLLSRGIDLATYNGNTTSVAESPSEENKKRKIGRTDLKTTKKQKTVDIRENLLADWDDDSDIEVGVDASKTATDFDMKSESEGKSEKKDTDNEAKEKSCFDFEDEEEEATIIHKSPGRKIPRVIPENQKNLSVDYNFPDVVLSPDILSKNSQKEKTDDDSTDDSLGTDRTDKNVSKVLSEKTVSEEIDDKKNDESIKEEFTNIMEQTSLPELPTLDSLKKFKRKHSKVKTAKRDRPIDKNFDDEKFSSVSEAEFEQFEKKFESEAKEHMMNEVDADDKISFENGSIKTDIYNENNVLESSKIKSNKKSKLLSMDDLNGRERIHMPSEYSLLDENLLESNDSEKENDSTSISFDEKSDEFTKDVVFDESKNEIKEKAIRTEEENIDTERSVEAESGRKSVSDSETLDGCNILKDDDCEKKDSEKNDRMINNREKTDKKQDVDESIRVNESYESKECSKIEEDKIDVDEENDNEIDKLKIEEDNLTSQSETSEENVQKVDNEKVIDTNEDIKVNEFNISDKNLKTKFTTVEETSKTTISNDFNVNFISLDITKECINKIDGNKIRDSKNTSVYSNEDDATSLANDIAEEFKTKETAENFEIIPDSELSPCSLDVEMQVSDNKKSTICDEDTISDDVKHKTDIGGTRKTSANVFSENEPIVASLTYTEESEFDSIENEIQRITSADSSPCKTNSFPENIAVVPTTESQISEIVSSTVDVKSEPEVKIGHESDAVKNTVSLESEIAKLTHTKVDESEIVQASKYSTSSSKLLEILTESKTNNEKAKLNLDEYSLVEVSDTSKKGFPTVAAKKHGMTSEIKSNAKTTKFVIKSTIQSKESSQKKLCKPIILSEEIIKPADDAKKVSVQKVTAKRSHGGEESIDRFIIKKPLKTTFVDSSCTQKTIETVAESGKRGSKIKSTVVSHSSTDRSSNKSVVDEAMFDINSMPIVLSDDLLTPENIQNMPIMITGMSEKDAEAEDKAEKPAGLTPKAGVSTSEVIKSPLKASLRSVVQQGLSKNQKVYQTGSTKLLQNKPAVITQPGKPGKFIILGSSSSPNTSGSKYTVGKRTKILNQTSVVLNKNHPIVSDVSAVEVEQKVGNKVMLLTHSQGQQSHIVLSPAQQKLLSSKIGANLVAKGTTTLRPKGKILSTHSIVTSKSNVVSLGPAGSKLQAISPQTVVTSKGQLLMPVHGQQIITSKGQILTPVHTDRMKSMKTVTQTGKRIQKIILPALASSKVKHGLTEIKPNTVVVRGKQTLKKLQPNILSGTPVNHPSEHIITKSGQTLALSSPVTSKSKIVQSRTAPQTSTKQVLRGPTGTQKIVFQKVSPTSETPQGRQQKTISAKIQKSCPSPKQNVRSPTSNNVSVPPLVPLSPGHSKTNDPNVITTSVGHAATPGLAESSVGSADTKGAERQVLKQIILQDEMGNQTTVTQGQILAVPDGESADGQGQFYVLVTVDESGNLLPLDNQALMALDPSIVGQDGNVVLQFNQTASREQKILPDETIADSSRTDIDGSGGDLPIDSQRLSVGNERRTITTPAETTDHDLILSDTGATPLERIAGADTISEPQNVTYSISNPGSNQQIIISGDSENAQQILNALASGNQDLSKLISGAEGNFIIDADRQQILLDTSGSDQIILTAPGDGLQLQESYCTDFVTQVSTNQDILAEALANTDVFQQEHAISDAISVVNNRTGGSLMSAASRLSPLLYQNMQLPNLASSTVLETSLTTLGPPIMSPLEVPSNGNSKKLSSDLDVDSDLGTQIPKSLQLPITITDPNISQTVSQQSQLSSDLTKSLGLPITVTDPNISSVGMSDLSSSAFNYSLPTLDDSPDFSIENTPASVSENENKGPISMPLLTDESELPSDDVRNRAEDSRIDTDGLGEIFDSRSDESRECGQESEKILSGAGTALDVLASVTTTKIMNTRTGAEIKSGQTTPDSTELEATRRIIDDNLESRRDDTINEPESDILRTDDRLDGDHPEINESAQTAQERFVLESPEDEIDSNSDEIALQPPITGETRTNLDTRISDVDESFAECVLENGEMIKKTSFDDVS